MLDVLSITGAVIVYITIVFMIAMKMKRLDVVDIAWGGAFIVAALTSFALGPKQGLIQLLVTVLVVLWGLRLAYSIYQRFSHAKKEDGRYTDLRNQWRGNLYLNAYVRIFLLQGILATIVSTSVILVNLSEFSAVGSYAFVGFVVWLVGFYFESVGDAELKAHLAEPSNKGKLMTKGLWRYTRHPNYFGEAVQWWGIFIIALSVPFGWSSVVAPLVITILLRFVSGVPITEKRFEGRPGWEEYKKRTSVFIPLLPRS